MLPSRLDANVFAALIRGGVRGLCNTYDSISTSLLSRSAAEKWKETGRCSPSATRTGRIDFQGYVCANVYIPTVLLISFVARRLSLGIHFPYSIHHFVLPRPIWNIVTISRNQPTLPHFFSASNLTFILCPLFLFATFEYTDF